MHSNFITPPDFVDNNLPTVLVIDALWDDVETLAMYCQTSKYIYNVYIYQDIMFDTAWLHEAAEKAHAIVLNSEASACTQEKNQFLKDSRTWYYGPNKYLGNNNQLQTLIDFFIKHNEQR
jgi:hypothetical protein